MGDRKEDYSILMKKLKKKSYKDLEKIVAEIERGWPKEERERHKKLDKYIKFFSEGVIMGSGGIGYISGIGGHYLLNMDKWMKSLENEHMIERLYEGAKVFISAQPAAILCAGIVGLIAYYNMRKKRRKNYEIIIENFLNSHKTYNSN